MSRSTQPAERMVPLTGGICTTCLPVDALIPFKKVTERGECALCNRHTDTIPLAELAAALGPLIQKYFEHGPTYDGVGSTGTLLEDLLEVLIPSETPGLHTTLADALIHTDSFFAGGQGYRQRSDAVDAGGPSSMWREFEETVGHRRRFFAVDAETRLKTILQRMDDVAGPARPHRIALAVGETIFRGRTANTSAEALSILADPIRGLAPPPQGKRRGGRLNAPGIPVFYGARSPTTLKSELRPAVGSYVVHGEFEVLRPLKLLDLSAFGREPLSASILAGRYHEVVEWRLFFQRLQHIISRPVLPGDEEAQYLPTQVLAEFLAKSGFDGILYLSAQRYRSSGSASSEQNVALFSGAELIEGMAAVEEAQDGVVISPALRFRTGSAQLEVVRATDVQTSRVHVFGGELIHPWDILE